MVYELERNAVDKEADSFYSGVAEIILDNNNNLKFLSSHASHTDSVTVLFNIIAMERKAGDCYDSIIGRFYVHNRDLYPIDSVVEKTADGYVLKDDVLGANCVLTTPICKVSNLEDYDKFAVNDEITKHIIQHPLVKHILSNIPSKSYGSIISSLVITNPKEVLAGEPMEVEYPINDEYGIGMSIDIRADAS